jgi:phosphoribosylformimino-5-aminoimidazole carboxamide ribotide isomerase
MGLTNNLIFTLSRQEQIVRCIFVLDILNGAVVHAVHGERNLYEPMADYSKLVSSSEPLDILHVLRPQEVYVADLNQLIGRGENLAIIKEISGMAKTMADTGISKASDLDCLPASLCPILGTETAPFKLMEELAPLRKIVVSLDMKNRKVLAREALLANETPLQVLQRLNHLPLEDVILLELNRVGTSSGLDKAFLEKAIAISKHPLILGGGVKNEEDLQALEEMGFSGALVATAVHNGGVPVEWIQ